MEYNGYIYWGTQSKLHRIAIANADDQWINVEYDWQDFAITDADFHPMAIQDLTLFIGDGNQVCSVDADGLFNDNALDINTPYRIKCMIDYEFDLLIGTFIANSINKTQIIRWDTVSPSWTTSDPIEEVGINAFIRDDNSMLVNAGRAGNIYYYDGEKLLQSKRVPGSYSSSAYGYVHPGSVANYMGQPVFGFSNGSGNPAKQGVYVFGSYSKDYAKTLDLSFPISEGVTSGIEIGAILVIDFTMYVAWKHGSVYGIDKLDYTAKYANAYFETTMMWQGSRDILKILAEVRAMYYSLPAGTSFTISYNKNNDGYLPITESLDDSILKAWRTQLTVPDIASLQIKVAFNVVNNDAPEMEALGVYPG